MKVLLILKMQMGISENYGKIFNIKLMKCGGITTGQQSQIKHIKIK